MSVDRGPGYRSWDSWHRGRNCTKQGVTLRVFMWVKPCCVWWWIVLNVYWIAQVKHLRLWIFECRDPSHQAFILGLSAAILLGLAHVIVNLINGCSCMCSQEELQKASSNRQLSVASLILTWYVFYLSSTCSTVKSKSTLLSLSHSVKSELIWY